MKTEDKTLLRTYKLKATVPRAGVLSLLRASKKPLSAQDIIGKLKKIDSVTVYRTLEQFAECGLISRVNISKERAYYEYVHSHHHHVVCTGCGKMEDIKNCATTTSEKTVLKSTKKFAQISSHSLEYFGLCNSCA